jgi:gamma-glutamylcyclotransferase (GGCT)/AIG2-like uncharacterized protein YtfP
MLQVFAYGTLKPGFAAHETLCRPWLSHCQPAWVKGRLYSLPIGYPAITLVTESAQDWVEGSLLTFKDATALAAIDDYEQHDPTEMAAYYPQLDPNQVAYQRQSITVFDPAKQPIGQAWAYSMSPKQIEQLAGVWQPSGNWAS